MTVKGIDISNYQSSTFSTAGLSFCFIKATEGHTYINPKMNAQTAHARAAGLHVGFYHYLHPGNIALQADYFMRKCASVPGDSLWLDWEQSGTTSAEKDEWIKAVQKYRGSNHRVGVYCNQDYWLHHDKSSFVGDALWIADYVAAGHPRIKAHWLFHQYTDRPVDTNVGNFADKAALLAWATKKPAPAPAPAPKPKPPKYVPFPGAEWFAEGRRSPIVAAMHDRLKAVGCNHYHSEINKDVIGSGDIASYEAWQRKCGYRGWQASWPPGKTTWDLLKVPAK